jgi:hypothetical protein
MDPQPSLAIVKADKNKGMSPEFLQGARDLDAQIEAHIKTVACAWIQIGIDCKEFADHGYHRALVNPATGVAFAVWRNGRNTDSERGAPRCSEAWRSYES